MVVRWGLVAMALAGCGRIGFDDNAPTDGGSGSGCIASLALGTNSACVVRKDGALYCWGDDSTGQLGIGRRTSTTMANTTVAIAATRITAGDRHTCAWGPTTAWCWGDNSYGQLGDGTTTSSSVPVPIGLGAPTVLVAGAATTCAIDGGVAKCWGKNNVGQIGNGTTVDSSQPVTVVGIGPVSAIATGTNHSCAIESATSDVYCWGAGFNGQLGNSMFVGSMMPTHVRTGTGTNFQATQISAGDQYTCAVDATNKAWCWGKNNNGELGDDNLGTRSNVPVAVMMLPSTVVDIDAGHVHTCAVLGSGAARCWGRNVTRLGNGDSATSAVPVNVMNLPDAVEIAIGENSTCARRTGGAMRCWGQNEAGELGTGTFDPEITAANSTVPLIGNVAVGGIHACAILASGGVTCWGSNTFGEHGTGEAASPLTPTRIAAGITRASVGHQHACAIAFDRTLACWGLNQARLGFLDPPEVFVPTPVPGLANLADVHAGGEMTCARDMGGAVTCWGAGRTTGTSSNVRVWTPAPVMGLGATSAVSIGESHTCAIDDATNAIACWGANGDGRLGNGVGGDALVPTPVVDLVAAESITLGNHTSCAVTAAREVWCWGDNGSGELAGASTVTVNRRPINTGVVADEATAGNGYVCARRGTALTCWGSNSFGVLGDPVFTDERAPGPVPGIVARTMASGGEYSCAITPDDDVWCWGRNSFGQLGDGTSRDRAEPMRVDVPCD